MTTLFDAVPKPSNRGKLLTEGLRVVHDRGFGGASVRDIVQAAGVPQGSFTNHFTSKEAFGVEIIDLYSAEAAKLAARTLTNSALPPLERIRAWLLGQLEYLTPDDMRKGCLYGNFSAEASEHSEAIRSRVSDAFARNEGAVAGCLRDAVESGELPSGFDVDGVSGFVISSMQGAILVAKAKRSARPIQKLIEILFGTVLR